MEVGGDRQGFLNIGGFAQYTLIEDVPDQFLLTGGVRWVAPCGSHSIYPGAAARGLMAPYLTVGKEFGDFHVLATGGLPVPVRRLRARSRPTSSTPTSTSTAAASAGSTPWSSSTAATTRPDVSFGLPTREGFIDFGNFENEGNVVTMAVGANAVLVKEHVEIGAVYTTVLAATRNFDANGLFMKMMFRY